MRKRYVNWNVTKPPTVLIECKTWYLQRIAEYFKNISIKNAKRRDRRGMLSVHKILIVPVLVILSDTKSMKFIFLDGM